jgi:Undecaprenyl-phosphate glucose phosphotransferase
MFHLDPKQAVLDHVAHPAPARPSEGLSDLAAAIADQPVDITYSDSVAVGIAQAVEIVLLLVVGLYVFGVNGGDTLLTVMATGGIVVVAEVVTTRLGLHTAPAYRRTEQIWKSAFAWTVAFAVLAAMVVMFDHGEALSRKFVGVFWASGLLVLVSWRLALHLMIVHASIAGRFRRRTVIVGGGSNAEELIAQLDKARDDFLVLGLFDDRNDERSPESVASVAKLGRVADLIEFARRTRVDLVIVSMPLFAEQRMLDMLRQLWVLPVDIRLSAHMSKLKFTPKAYSYIGGTIPVFDMADRPISDWNRVLKWLFDKLVAITALILLSPVMIATAIAIKLESKGPVFFRQKRLGFNNKIINIWKFRSMRTDMLDADASKLVTRDDPRVTRVGKFIRKTSIDELPQLFNVLTGELSVVGPRPHALAAKAENQLYHDAVDGYFARHRVKPGMTGWAQINGWRGETDTVEKIMQRVEHDLYYIEHWSPWLDLKIVLLTPIALFTGRKNAF